MNISPGVLFYIFLILLAFEGFFFSLFSQYEISLYILLLFVASGGFLLSFYIRYMKHAGKELVCPTGSNCKTVITSEYAQFFGIPLEIWGMLYYGIIASTYTALVVFPGVIHEGIIFTVIALTSGAFLFSIYLTFVQAFALKQWCMWCLLSAVFSSVIFVVSLGRLAVGTSFLIEIYPGLVAAHLFAFALGIGGATIAGILFFKFLKDFRISDQEVSVLRTISQAIWFSTALLVLTEFALYLPVLQQLNSSPQFVAKMAAILVLVVSGAILNIIVAPRLFLISFKGEHDTMRGKLLQFRKIIFGLGALSFASWYFAFTLEVTPLSFTLPLLLIAYIVFLCISVVISQIIEREISRSNVSPTE